MFGNLKRNEGKIIIRNKVYINAVPTNGLHTLIESTPLDYLPSV